MNPVSGPFDASRGIKILLERGTDQAAFIIRLKSDPSRFIEVKKYLDKQRNYGCRCELPASLSPQGFETLRRELGQRGIAHEHVTDVSGERIAIDFGKDRGLAAIVTWMAIEHLLSSRSQTDCEFFFRRVSIRNVPTLTGVDSPEDPWWG